MAGTQDNGTFRYTGSLQWDAIAGGDGGDCGVNQLNPDVIYHSFYRSLHPTRLLVQLAAPQFSTPQQTSRSRRPLHFMIITAPATWHAALESQFSDRRQTGLRWRMRK